MSRPKGGDYNFAGLRELCERSIAPKRGVVSDYVLRVLRLPKEAECAAKLRNEVTMFCENPEPSVY